jgi:protein-L-isoaspartate(D-aspartate) O-methyltransferase
VFIKLAHVNALPLTDPFERARAAMVEHQLFQRGIRAPRVLAAVGRVPRHEFVPSEKLHEAYEDHPIVIGESQTISQPYMVAAMLEAARILPADVVLEVGTGSGYETALLAELAAEVFTVERLPSLADAAQRLLAHLNYANVVVTVGDGSAGLPAAAPFDVIVVAAAAPSIPPTLVDQLREGGRLVVPVGGTDDQILTVVTRDGRTFRQQRLWSCKFVPLIGKYGFSSPS